MYQYTHYDDMTWAAETAKAHADRGHRALHERVASLEEDMAKLKLFIKNLTGVDL